RSIGKKWKLQTEGATIILDCEDIHSLYTRLLQLCYLTPFMERILPIGIQLFNVRGKYGLWWARRKLSESGP
ncbi:MAG: hypothetical protein GY866_40600, partial [Proteobacteria bacterium]|nr:hypothetical protein [Pseudomonadota bacterium]